MGTGPRFLRYVALGDSMSIDLYPGLDHMARVGGLRPAVGLGAASLFHRNRGDLYPVMEGRDLATAFPGIESLNLCVDGATVGDTEDEQLPSIPGDGAPTLFTVTAGGNDLLRLVGAPASRGDAEVSAALHRLRRLLAEVRRGRPGSVLLVATVYDPTDGTGRLDHIQLDGAELGWLQAYNAGVRRLCDGDTIRLADAHSHFLGHGKSAPPGERWYWPRSIIEPGELGASELRRLWLQALAI
jgi:lysophospholipase L1-like esterase